MTLRTDTERTPIVLESIFAGTFVGSGRMVTIFSSSILISSFSSCTGVLVVVELKRSSMKIRDDLRIWWRWSSCDDCAFAQFTFQHSSDSAH
uniref:Uncharacterized protein n=1 Tax=Romanomermis culicivorax TaxID=13658 RepID=A0A915IFA7_ROMCU